MDDIELEGAGSVVLDWGTANGCSRSSLILSRLVSSGGKIFRDAQAIIWTSPPVKVDCRVIQHLAGRLLVVTCARWQAPLPTVLIIMVNRLI